MSKKENLTHFPNKIGLFVNENDEVVLNFPYKDCVLEAGMTKEDSKREKEYFLQKDRYEGGKWFYNQGEHIDDVNTLFAPKNFTNFKKIDKNGEKPLTENDEMEFWDENGNLKQNLLVKGNNLVALHSLATRLAGKVKLIYIDPPYNTGGNSDSFSYNDKFKRSTWLTFMKSRLEIAYELLSDDGSIFIQCDENENAYLRVLLDEIFGEKNRINEIIWRYRTYIGNVKGYFPKKHDTIFWYIKNNRPDFNLIYDDNYTDTVDFKRWGKFLKNGNQIIYGDHPDTDSRFTAYLNKYIKQFGEPNYGDVIYQVQGYVIDDVWEDIIAIDPKNITEKTDFKGGQKPEALVERIIQAVTNPGDLVLDYHLGSGTTAAVAHKMGRRWIGIEQMDYIDTIAKERLKKVIDGEQGGISKSVNWQGGGEFVYFELKTFNADFAREIENATTKTRLNEIYQDMKRSAFLKFFFNPDEFEKEETDEGKKYSQLSLEEQKEKLIAILDMNHIYLNLENNNAIHDVSETDKFLTRKFYGKDE